MKRQGLVSGWKRWGRRHLVIGKVAAVLFGLLATVATPAPAATDDTTLVSRATDGAAAMGHSSGSSVSADGRFIAFVSDADNLSDDDDNAYANVYVRDRDNGTTTLVSRADEATALTSKANGSSYSPSISSDGRFIAFVSGASNLSARQDVNGYADVYVRNLQAGTTTLVSRADGPTGAPADGGSDQPSISADGTRVAFTSNAKNLSTTQEENECYSWEGPYPCPNFFVRDLQSGTTAYLAPMDVEGESCGPAISSDGRFVAVGTQGFARVFDLQKNASTLASRADGPEGAAAEGFCPSISADGRFVAFHSGSAHLSQENNDTYANVYRRDLQDHKTTLVSRADGATGIAANNSAYDAKISGDGRFVAFESPANNLSSYDTNKYSDIFVRDLQTDDTTYVSRASGVSSSPSDAASWYASISGDGRFVAFQSDANNLSDEDLDATRDVYVRELGASMPEPPGLPDLRLSMVKFVDTWEYVGREVTFRVTVANEGVGEATGVAVTDQLPAGLTFVSATPSQGTYTADTGVWSVGSMASGATATLHLVARIDTVGHMVNYAEVTAADQADPDSQPGNHNSAEDDAAWADVTGSEPPPRADLSVAMTASNSAPAVGSDVTFTVTLANAGWSEATGVTMWDQLPAGLTFVSATPSQGTYRDDVDVWTVGSVASDGTAILQLVARAAASGSWTNTAEVNTADVPDPDSQPGNHKAEDDQASVTVTVSPPADTTPPTVGTVFPTPGKTGVSRSVTITASFSEPMDPNTINTAAGNVTIKTKSSGAVVAAVITCASPCKSITVKPSSSLAPSTWYVVTIKGGPAPAGVKDLAGNPLAVDKVWEFKTKS